jgi:uracil-DNA glycosylase
VNRRAQYLEALGIDTWALRTRTAPEPLESAAESEAEPLPLPLTRASATPAAPAIAPAMSTKAPAGPLVAMTWEPLAATVRECRLCGLEASRTQTVFGVGNRQAELLVVGEAPGADEDQQGEPFVGRAGQLLNSMLRAGGFPRETVYIANILKCRPPNNRDPAPAEVACCLPYLKQQIALIGPRLMLAVGRIAAQNLLATETPIGKLRGAVHSFGEQRIPLIVTYHPAYLLRSPSEKRRVWTDLKFVRNELARLRQQASA